MILLAYGIAALAALGAIWIANPLAEKFQLMDIPDHRKTHAAATPLTGSLSLFAGTAAYTAAYALLGDAEIDGLFLACACTIFFIGLLDDMHDLCAKKRLLAQTAVISFYCLYGQREISFLGDIFFWAGDITLGALAAPFTIMCTVGLINAFNMIDGIDGLLGGLSICCFSSLAVLFALSGHTQLSAAAIAFVVCLIPYLLFNLSIGPFRRKIFMGDAGSTLIGFFAMWFLIEGTQGPDPGFSPVTALWIVCLPLLDMIRTVIGRVIRKRSPFRPGRDHLHHILLRAGLSPRTILLAAGSGAVGLAAIGIAPGFQQLPAWQASFLFVLLAVLYGTGLDIVDRKSTAAHGSPDPAAGAAPS